MVESTTDLDRRLVLKIADTQDELEACFHLLHDSYVTNGYMRPHPSGLRVTPYHALPTTTTLCAKFDGEVVGTISLIREGVFGFPLQQAFDLHGVRSQTGQIAEVSALAVHPEFRMAGGGLFLPLMKFMFEYCTRYFDTRHLVIAVHPKRIDFYQSLLCFNRLNDNVVDRYDFANGAPAVGATLDLHQAEALFRRAYAHKSGHRNLAVYFFDTQLPNIQWPARHYHVTNDPAMTADLLDHFFNQRTDAMALLDRRQLSLLHSIYPSADYRRVLPPLTAPERREADTRRHSRYSLHCPASFAVGSNGHATELSLDVIDVSHEGFQASTNQDIALGTWGRAHIELGPDEYADVTAQAVRCHDEAQTHYIGFRLSQADAPWQRFINRIEDGSAHRH